ncbi:hypothetical protein Taro_044333 [Colocasia esculenta]|uniref:Protein kinase domain-containing protein n=1 Tax=Colocasia esculenta TaxID=4460 RepID=A0A843X2H9_COLES|nr:hypothetical protein [Colocasia esculenta]
MEFAHVVCVVLGVCSPFLAVFLLFLAIHHYRNRSYCASQKHGNGGGAGTGSREEVVAEAEKLVTFPGGEDLTSQAILDAPGEVVARSSHGTLYRAWLGGEGSPVSLRFVRPECVGTAREVLQAAQLLGLVRHPNLVPLRALYVGSHGEKLLVQPYFPGGTLFHFLNDGSLESHRWEVIHKLSLGIAKALDHLHNGLQRPLVHGGLNTSNILLGADQQPHLSAFGLHLLLNTSSAQEVLEESAVMGYKAPELIKMKDVSKESDVYSFGVILLEMVTRKEPRGGLLPAMDVHLSNSSTDSAFDCEVPEMLGSGLITQTERQSCKLTEQGLLMFFQLALACCAFSPSSRPGIRQVLRKLETIGCR